MFICSFFNYKNINLCKDESFYELLERLFSAESFKSVLKEGFGFDGSSVGLASIEDSDLVGRLIGNTQRVLPSDGFKTVFFLCEIFKDEKPFKLSGRGILNDLLLKLKEKFNYRFFIGPELEFYLTKEGKPIDEAGYMFSNPMDKANDFKKEFISFIQERNPDFKVELAHHEVGPSQHEFKLKFDEAIRMIDKLVSFRYLLKNFAKNHGFEVTFMPKPFYGLAGNGLHLHLSLWEDNIPLFYENKYELSELGKNFIAGILEHSREIALVINGTVNSYKRLILGHEAPVYLIWGYKNRSAAIRVPKYHEIKPETARIEIRIPDSLNNPYLAIASLIKAGMIGIEKKMEAPEPFQRSAYELNEEKCDELGIKVLPRNLKDAIKQAKNGKILKDLLGKGFDSFVKEKEKEWKEYCDYLENIEASQDTNLVTEWERKRYFNM